MFCPGKKCPHYNKATKYPRQCYYEAQCWRGELDLIFATLRIMIKEKFGRSKQRQED